MNIPEIDIGDAIEDLKRQTPSGTSPLFKGQAVKNCEFVRKVHNSFARKSDLFTQVKELKLPRKPAPKRKSKGFTNKKRKKAAVDDDNENAFHFIAFVPINGTLWKLDGMDAFPMNLGRIGSDWMEKARPEISARMAAYETDNITFSLQALCASPLVTIPPQLAENVAQLVCIDSTLDDKYPDWAVYLDPDSSSTNLILSPDETIGLTPELLKHAKGNLETSEKFKPKITVPGKTVMDLMDMREKVVKEQNKLRGAYMEEIVSMQTDEERTRARRRSREDNSAEVSSDKSALELDPLSEGMDTIDSKNTPRREPSSSLSSIRRSSPAPTPSPAADANTETEEDKERAADKKGSEDSFDILGPLEASLNIHSDKLTPPQSEP